MPRISTDNYDTVASWNGSQDLFVVEQPDGTKVATPAMVKQFIEAGDFEATGEVKDGHGNILADMAKNSQDKSTLMKISQREKEHYTTLKEMLENGKNVILEIDVQGAVKIKENCKDGVFIFILPPSMEELKNRLTKRGTETPEEILRRFNTAYEEIKYIDKYNYGVVNDVVEDAVAKIDKILEAEKCRVTRIKDSIIKEAKL